MAPAQDAEQLKRRKTSHAHNKEYFPFKINKSTINSNHETRVVMSRTKKLVPKLERSISKPTKDSNLIKSLVANTKNFTLLNQDSTLNSLDLLSYK